MDKLTFISVFSVVSSTNSSVLSTNITETFLNVSGSSQDCCKWGTFQYMAGRCLPVWSHMGVQALR